MLWKKRAAYTFDIFWHPELAWHIQVEDRNYGDFTITSK